MSSTNGWFGVAWPSPDNPAPVCEDEADRWDHPPEGEECFLCEEEIAFDQSGVVMPVWKAEQGGSLLGYAHKECQIRAVLGNHLHVRGLCSYVGECNERSQLSYRDEALKVWEYVVEENGEIHTGPN